MQETLIKETFPPVHPQRPLWNQFGLIALNDDTAVKTWYRTPISVFAVIDNDYRARVVSQSITADTMTDTFVW